jgi:hypothetical protein
VISQERLREEKKSEAREERSRKPNQTLVITSAKGQDFSQARRK